VTREYVRQALVIVLQGLGAKDRIRPLILDQVAQEVGLLEERSPEVQQEDLVDRGRTLNQPRSDTAGQTTGKQGECSYHASSLSIFLPYRLGSINP
jgi:hypothetical protein